MGYSAVRELASTFYNDLEQRPEMVRQGLEKCGIEKVLGPKEIERLAGWSTRAGISTQITEVREVAAPYLKMDTKELVTEGAKLLNSSIIQPSIDKATPYVQDKMAVVKEKASPYVAKGAPYVAPYVQKGLDTKEAVMKDERVQKAVAALKVKFAAVRERPADVARDLRVSAVDLIKYEKVGEYRAYVCSEEFVNDTKRLVTEDLPALAKEAARKGAGGVQAGAVLMKEELSNASAIVGDAWKKGREEHDDLRSWDALTGLARVLVAEVSEGLTARAEEVELKAKLSEVVARIKSVFGLSEAEKMEEPADGKAKEADDADQKEELEAEEEEEYEDAKDKPDDEDEADEAPPGL